MGAWGTGTFENDTACDWAGDLESATDLSPVVETLVRVIEVGDDYLDADAGCEALAACEVVARLKGNWGIRDAYTETLDAWVREHAITPSKEVISQALTAVFRISREGGAVGRYAAKLLFVWDPDPMTNRRDRRLCEERVVLFQSRSALFAVKKAKSIGKASQLRYVSGHQLRFAGVLECMEMDESLHVFTDGTRGARRAKRPVNPPLQPTRRPNMSRATRTRR